MVKLQHVESSGPGHLDPRIRRTRHDVLSAALDMVLDGDVEALSHARLASASGYAKATIYKHWPTRADIVRDALLRLGEVEHHRPTGDLRDDLIAEVTVYRRAMELHRLDRAIVVLVNLADSVPELHDVRAKLVTDGERLVRGLLAPHLEGARLEAAALMLVGAILQSALMHSRLPGDDVIAASVDLVLAGFDLSGTPRA